MEEPGIRIRERDEERREDDSRCSLAMREGEGWDFGRGGPGVTVLSNADLERSLRMARAWAEARHSLKH